MTDSPSPEHDYSALAYTWGKYRVYALTSRKRKAKLSVWRLYVLAFIITGALLATLSQQTSSLTLSGGWSWVPSLLGALSAIALGLAVFFGREIVNPGQEREWIRTRSMAEALKSQAYRFVTDTPPFNSKADKETCLFERTNELLEKVRDLPTESISEVQRHEKLPTDSLTVEQYIRDRVNNQIEDYYIEQSVQFTRKLKRIKAVGLGLGVLAIVLGTLGFTGWTAGWVATISTITASITAYVYASRYQYLIVSYQATANKLESLLTSWEMSHKTKADADQLIINCEEAISVENSAWMAELTKDK